MFVSLLDTLSPIRNIVYQPSVSKRSLPSTPTLHPSPSPPEPAAFSLPPNHVQDTAFLILPPSEMLGDHMRHYSGTSPVTWMPRQDELGGVSSTFSNDSEAGNFVCSGHGIEDSLPASAVEFSEERCWCSPRPSSVLKKGLCLIHGESHLGVIDGFDFLYLNAPTRPI
ncbi:hypothetical protein FOZ60_010770 [Perkinsus olseni]|uniref:Uncharacterized protein n=1 Tax=Perkinsus olseni TaxID=32597 RepID=A0A7J6NEN1_PEROL|nr:hypothetical protein FOZ60_010770 [Perkinsus olseni]